MNNDVSAGYIMKVVERLHKPMQYTPLFVDGSTWGICGALRHNKSQYMTTK